MVVLRRLPPARKPGQSTKFVALALALSVPGLGLAGGGHDMHRREQTRSMRGFDPTSRTARRASPVFVAIETAGDSRARTYLSSALEQAVSASPALELVDRSGQGAALVLSGRVRVLTVSRDDTGVLARCDIGLVVTDGAGAVRASLDARRTVRESTSATEDQVAQTALRGAADGMVRNVVSQLLGR